jgi:hypothetical protein
MQPILHHTDDSDKTHYDDLPQQYIDAIPEVPQALNHSLVLKVLPSQPAESIKMSKPQKPSKQQVQNYKSW